MKKNSKYIIFSIIIILLINIWLVYEISISNRIYDYGLKKTKEVESIDFKKMAEGIELKQKFIGKYNNLNRITINFSDIFYNSKTVEQSILIGIKETDTGRIIAEEEVLLNHIRVEKGYKFEFEKQKDSKGKSYLIYVKCNKLNSDNPIYTIKYYDTDVYKETELIINEKVTNFDLDFRDTYINEVKIICLYVIIVILDIVIFAIGYSIYRDKKVSAEKVFLKVVPLFALLMCLSISMGNGKDEPSHLFRAYEISEGVLATRIIWDNPRAIIPKTIQEITYYRTGTYENLINMFGNSIECEKIPIINTTSALYSPVQYIPHVTGIVLSKLITNDAVIITYAGRIGNMIACILILYFAIKTTPFGKNIFLVLSMLPITIAGISTLSADGLTISASFLFIAYVLKLAFEDNVKVRKRDLIILGILTVFIALCKIVYLPLIGLLLIIPNEKWGGRTDKIIKIAALWIIGISASLLWLSTASGLLSIDRDGDSIIKLGLILENPFRYIQIILHTIMNYTAEWINSIFGGDLQYDSSSVLAFPPYILMFLIGAVIFMDNNIKKIEITNFQKVIIILVCLAIIFLTFTSLYLQWTEYGLNYVKGVQGRYFIPILPLVLILLGRLKFKGEYKEENVTKAIGIVGAIIQIPIIMLLILQHI